MYCLLDTIFHDVPNFVSLYLSHYSAVCSSTVLLTHTVLTRAAWVRNNKRFHLKIIMNTHCFLMVVLHLLQSQSFLQRCASIVKEQKESFLQSFSLETVRFLNNPPRLVKRALIELWKDTDSKAPQSNASLLFTYLMDEKFLSAFTSSSRLRRLSTWLGRLQGRFYSHLLYPSSPSAAVFGG